MESCNSFPGQAPSRVLVGTSKIARLGQKVRHSLHVATIRQRLVDRDYQKQIQDAVARLSKHRTADGLHPHILFVAPTGAGKGHILTHLAFRLDAVQRKVLVCVHLIELVKDLRDRFERAGLRVGLIASGYPRDLTAPIQICMIQTLVKCAAEVAKDWQPDTILVDEAHHAVADTYAAAIAPFGDRLVIGCTATPERLSGEGLGQFFTHMVNLVSPVDLINRGFLCRPLYYVAQTDLKGLHSRGGEFVEADLMQRFDRPVMYDGLLDLYRKHAEGLQTIIYNCNRAHSQKTADALNAAGYRAIHIDGKTSDAERERIITAFTAGEYTHLCNVSLFVEGFDCPGVSCIIFNRATMSRTLWCQGVGRGARPTAGFTADTDAQRLAEVAASDKPRFVVLDLGGNLGRLGFWEEPREYSLDSPKRKSKKSDALGILPIKLCPKCGLMVAVQQRECDGQTWGALSKQGELCGYVWPTTSENLKTGEFVAVTYGADGAPVVGEPVAKKAKPHPRDLWPEHLRYAYHTPAKLSEDELKEVQKAAGYKRGWVHMQLARKKPDSPAYGTFAR
jgi:DNA repair protein RadD